MNEHLRRIEQHAAATRTKYLDELQDWRELMALPGARVTVTRAPWPVGATGLVLGVWESGPRRKARVDLNGRLLSIPIEALTRQPGGPDCREAFIAYTAAWIKYNSGEFLE